MGAAKKREDVPANVVRLNEPLARPGLGRPPNERSPITEAERAEAAAGLVKYRQEIRARHGLKVSSGMAGRYDNYTRERMSYVLMCMFSAPGLFVGLIAAEFHFAFRMMHVHWLTMALPLILPLAAWLFTINANLYSKHEKEWYWKATYRALGFGAGWLLYIPIRLIVHQPIISLLVNHK